MAAVFVTKERRTQFVFIRNQKEKKRKPTLKPRFVMNLTTMMVDEGKVHAKTEDPYEDVGKLEKDEDKAMNEENEIKIVKKIAHASKGCQNLCPNKPKDMKIQVLMAALILLEFGSIRSLKVINTKDQEQEEIKEQED
uniref:Uncharacterized protein n=1 Tax=Tanacetum cinerariifolium TaxID=118510 RepID=A0A699I892_TANCI|nr:hypothetical protein [Tanacetum cinerariifolium]